MTKIKTQKARLFDGVPGHSKAQTRGLEVRFWKVALGFWTDDGLTGSSQCQLTLSGVGVEKVTSISRMRFGRSMLEESIHTCSV